MIKNQETIIGVITGDIVASSNLDNKEDVINDLKEAFEEIKDQISKDIQFEIYRGDSFQGIILPASKALKVAILLRARLINFSNQYSDARIGIGLGTINYRSKNIVESDGEAFKNSGHLIDILEKEKKRLGIKTPWQEITNLLDALISLIDAIINDWTKNDAETAYQVLLYDLTQKALAKKLNISQPAINKRIARAKMDVLKYVLKRFEETINKQINE